MDGGGHARRECGEESSSDKTADDPDRLRLRADPRTPAGVGYGTFVPRPRGVPSHARAKASRAAHGRRLAQMAGAVEEREPAQQRGARTPGEDLHQHLGAPPERTLVGRVLDGLRRRHAFPVLRLEAAHDLARTRADRVAVLAQRAQLDLTGELGHLGARHADAEVAAAEVELLGPAVVEHLRATGQHRIEEDVLGAGDVKDDPGDRVQVLAGPHTHLLVGETAVGALGRRHLVTADGSGVHGGVLLEEEIFCIHGPVASCDANRDRHSFNTRSTCPPVRGRCCWAYHPPPMKVTALDTYFLSAPLPQPVRTSTHTIASVSEVIVKITTDTGLVGIGEGHGPFLFQAGPDGLRSVRAILDAISPLVLGQDPFDAERVWQDLFALTYTSVRGIPALARQQRPLITALSAIDIALWDLKGKAIGRPVWALLGG